MTPQELKQLSGIPDDYDPNAPVTAPATAQPATPDPNDPRPALKAASGIPPGWTPTEAKSTTTPISSEIVPALAGFGSGLKTTIDYPAEKLAWLVGQQENLHNADQQSRQEFLDKYGTDPYATAGDVAGKITGALTVGKLARVLAAPAEAYALANPLIQAIPKAAAGINAAGSALEGYVGSAVTGGDRAIGAAVGGLTPGLQYLAKAASPIAAAVAAGMGWKYGANPMEALMGGGGAGVMGHYLAPPIEWFAKQAAKFPALTGALAGNTLPNPLMYDPNATQAQAAATP